jgi:hypothetical protein
MGLFKSSDRKKHESGLSLLQGLFILAILGVIATVILTKLAG